MISVYSLHFVDTQDFITSDGKVSYDKAEKIAKQHGGRYVPSVKNVHTSGFCFKSKGSAEAFVAEIKDTFSIE